MLNMHESPSFILLREGKEGRGGGKSTVVIVFQKYEREKKLVQNKREGGGTL